MVISHIDQFMMVTYKMKTVVQNFFFVHIRESGLEKSVNRSVFYIQPGFKIKLQGRGGRRGQAHLDGQGLQHIFRKRDLRFIRDSLQFYLCQVAVPAGQKRIVFFEIYFIALKQSQDLLLVVNKQSPLFQFVPQDLVSFSRCIAQGTLIYA